MHNVTIKREGLTNITIPCKNAYEVKCLVNAFDPIKELTVVKVTTFNKAGFEVEVTNTFKA